MNTPTFRKSRHSDMHDSCVELGRDGVLVRVRDSKAPGTGTLGFSVAEMRSFFAEVRAR
ncbi:DUF397 domain-containing protein [Actinomadura chokoriensis]|uniref:DUF397 domain-containing protein n=1 Tax=Actinomadura chokoriensis TaxID=454156 RepID=UPI0031F89B97